MITWWLLWSTWEFGYNSTMGYQMSRWYAHFHNESIHQFGSIYMVFGCLWFPRTSFNISVYVAFKIHNIYIYCVYYIYINIYCIYIVYIHPSSLLPWSRHVHRPPSLRVWWLPPVMGPMAGWNKGKRTGKPAKSIVFHVFSHFACLFRVAFCIVYQKMRFDEVKELDQKLCRQNQLTTPSMISIIYDSKSNPLPAKLRKVIGHHQPDADLHCQEGTHRQ